MSCTRGSSPLLLDAFLFHDPENPIRQHLEWPVHQKCPAPQPLPEAELNLTFEDGELHLCL